MPRFPRDPSTGKVQLWKITEQYKGPDGRLSRKDGRDLDRRFPEQWLEEMLEEHIQKLIYRHWDKRAEPPGEGFWFAMRRAGRDGALPGFDPDVIRHEHA